MIKPTRQIFSVSDIVPASYNPRKISKKQKDGLSASLDRFGYLQDIIVNIRGGLNVIVGGHKRMEALGLPATEQIECTVVDLSPIEEKALNVALNNRHTGGDYDQDGLEKILNELSEWEGFNDLNFDDLAVEFDFDLSGDDEQPGDGDKIPEEPGTVVIKLGDLIELGGHRLLCGDSTDAEQVSVLMGGEKADMVFTDPPYGMNLDTDYSDYTGSNNSKRHGLPAKKHKKVTGDNEDFKPELIKTVFNNFNYCKEIFLWGSDYYIEFIKDKNNGSWIVWDKTGGNDSLLNAGFSSNFELCWSKQKHKRDIARVTYKGVAGMTKDDGKRVHPTQKPVNLVLWFFDKWGKNKIKIADLYLGSGSTLIAAEKTNRRCYGMELDEKYCQVIIQRWCDYTGRDDIKINGEPVSWREYSAATEQNAGLND